MAILRPLIDGDGGKDSIMRFCIAMTTGNGLEWPENAADKSVCERNWPFYDLFINARGNQSLPADDAPIQPMLRQTKETLQGGQNWLLKQKMSKRSNLSKEFCLVKVAKIRKLFQLLPKLAIATPVADDRLDLEEEEEGANQSRRCHTCHWGAKSSLEPRPTSKLHSSSSKSCHLDG